MIVNPGDDVALSGTTAAATPSLAGTVEADELVSFRDSRAGVSGVVQVRVVRSAGRTLDFYYRVTELTGGDLWSVGWNLVGPTVTTDIDFRLDGLGAVGPSRVSRHDFGSDPTRDHVASLDFYFGGALRAGDSSRFVFVKTGATAFDRTSSLGLVGAPAPDGTNSWEALVDAFVPPASY